LSRSVHPAVGMIVPALIVTRPGVIRFACALKTSYVPSIATGTIGRSDFNASRNAPR